MTQDYLWQHCVPPTASIQTAAEILDSCKRKVVIVVDDEGRLLGTVTDGDIRRGIIRGVTAQDEVRTIMNCQPLVAKLGDDQIDLRNSVRLRRVREVPVVDEHRRVVAIDSFSEDGSAGGVDSAVFILAGGQGLRLRPLTENCPKPMLRIGGKPILEITLEHLIAHGFRRFFISVNYRAEMIVDYFGDGRRWNVDISYVHETQPLGTAGSLALLHETPRHPMIVMNGDIITQVNFLHLLDFHLERNAAVTMAVRKFDFQLPFGVVEVNGGDFAGISEKPTYSRFVNAGIYCIDPSAIQMITPNIKLDMPELIQKLVQSQKSIQVFPVREYWTDIGRHDDFSKAQADFAGSFTVSDVV